MSPRSLIAVTAAFLLAGSLALAAAGEPISREDRPAEVVFVCRNGVSMSVWSAAYFNRLASERGLRERAVARAAIPSYGAVPLRMRFALALDGFRLGGYRPKVVDAEDLRSARQVVVVQGTDDTAMPPAAAAPAARIEEWRGFAPMREDYFPARTALRARVENLVAQLAEGRHRSMP